MAELIYAATTVTTPSSFGMPTCGHAPVITAVTPAQASLLATSVRERKAVNAGFMGGVDFVQTRIPGTPAWRPPICS